MDLVKFQVALLAAHPPDNLNASPRSFASRAAVRSSLPLNISELGCLKADSLRIPRPIRTMMKRSLKGKIARFAIRSLTSMFSIKIMDLVVSELLAKDRLVSRHGFYYLTKLAEKLNVVALSVRGDYGTFVGASADAAILRRY